ncbi:MAG TPA: hypothetical protein VEI95_07990 [Acidobacteriota bacterium]|nr:hypothetical protein [Acidobacteriota bacterium]
MGDLLNAVKAVGNLPVDVIVQRRALSSQQKNPADGLQTAVELSLELF